MFNDSWHWINGEKENLTPGPRVINSNWGIYEPGRKFKLKVKRQIIFSNSRWWRVCCHGFRNGLVLECCEMYHFRFILF